MHNTRHPTMAAVVLLPPRSNLRRLLLSLLLFINTSNGIPSDEVSMGTTILAVRFHGGVVAGADTRTSVSGYVSNRYAAKLTFVLEKDVDSFVLTTPRSSLLPSSSSKDEGYIVATTATSADTATNHKINDDDDDEASTCVICRSGSAADTQKLASLVRSELVSRQLVYRIRGTVTHVAALLRTLLLQENNSKMSAGMICAGYDHELGRGVIYTVGPGGIVLEEKFWAAGGSGSSYILGHLDSWYANQRRGSRNKMSGDGFLPDEDTMLQLPSEEEAIEFVSNAIQLAMERDGSSGGFIRMYVIDRFGKRFVSKMMANSASGGTSRSIEDCESNTMFLRNFAPAVSPSSQ